MENIKRQKKDGFVFGQNTRTGRRAVFPMNVTEITTDEVELPTYPEVNVGKENNTQLDILRDTWPFL